MDIQTLRKAVHLSASGISDYTECGLQYKFGRIDKLKPEFKADALIFGSAIHAALADYYAALEGGVKLTVKKLQKIFEIYWVKMALETKNIKYRRDKDYASLLLEGKELLAVFYNNLPEEDCTILGIEEPFSFAIDGVPADIIGVYDLVTEDPSGIVTIVDHKTSGKSFSNADVDNNFQMSLYNLAARENGFADRDILLRFDALIKTKTPKFEQYYTTRTEIDEKRTIKKIQTVWEGISKGVFVPNETSWKCAGCSYQKACQRWFLKAG